MSVLRAVLTVLVWGTAELRMRICADRPRRCVILGKQATYTVAQHEAKEKLGIKSSSCLAHSFQRVDWLTALKGGGRPRC